MTHECRRRQAGKTRPSTRPIIDGAATGKRPDRATRLLSRVDDHLRGLTNDAACRSFLVRQQAEWEHRYARFVATNGASEAVASSADPPQAADFLITITGLAARRIALEARTQEVAMPDRHANDHLGRAIRSLLVAADQRCPTIIGQAHLLHHARFASRPENAADSIAELKRAADDLCGAIAAVEAAMQDASWSRSR